MDKETTQTVRKLMGDTSLSAIEILDKLEMEFETHYRTLLVDSDIAHLHKAEAIKDIIEFIVEHDEWRDSIPDFSPELGDDIRRMKEYLAVTVHLDSPVTPKSQSHLSHSHGNEIVAGRYHHERKGG